MADSWAFSPQGPGVSEVCVVVTSIIVCPTAQGTVIRECFVLVCAVTLCVVSLPQNHQPGENKVFLSLKVGSLCHRHS